MKKVILSAFGGLLESKIMDWPDTRPPYYELALPRGLVGAWTDLDKLSEKTLEQLPPTRARFEYRGHNKMVDGQEVEYLDMVEIL